MRCGRLPVFAVSEPRARPTQEALARSERSSRYRATAIELSCIAELPKCSRYRAHGSMVQRLPKRITPPRKVAFIRLHFGSHPSVLRTDSNASAHAGYGVGLCTLQGCHAGERPEEFARSAAATVPPLSVSLRRHSKAVHESAARPNHSIEGTSNIWLRQLSAAPHVKR